MHTGAAAGMLGGMGNMAYALISPVIGRTGRSESVGHYISAHGSLPWLALISILPVARRFLLIAEFKSNALPLELFRGIFPAALTMFDTDNNIDEAALRKHWDWLIRQGVDGLVIAGTSGEFIALENHERSTAVQTRERRQRADAYR